MASLSTLTNAQYYFLCLFLWVLSISLLRSFFGKSTKKIHLPPSPPALPLIGHLHLLAGSSMYKSLHKLSLLHGPLFCLRLGPYRTMVVVSSASVATEVFKANDLAISNRPALAVADKAPYAGAGFFYAPYGKYWRFMKKLSMTQLLSTTQIQHSRSIRREELVLFLCRLFDSAQRRELVDLGTEFLRFTNNSTCKMAMSLKVSGDSSEAEQIRALVKESLQLGSKLYLGDVLGPFKRLSFWMYGKKAIDVTMRYDAILERLWKEHEESGKRDNEDLLDILMKVYKDEKAEFKMNRTHIKAFLLDLFIAGTSTSADILQWTLSELINRPQMLKKLRDEIVSVVGTATRLVEETDVPNLPYLQAVVKETLRMYPPIAVTARECREDCKIKGYDISQNTMLAINLYSIMRDPEVWDNPNEFRPERFLVSNNSKVLHKHQNHENELTGHQSLIDFVPFGAGRRGCPGSTLAYTTINQTIAAIVQCFDWKVGDGGDHDQPPPKVDMEVENSGFGVNKAQSLVCLPIVHFNPFASC
ncbi:cytochrome P450 705A22-like [Juglans microcarpa x Juglans regia]|uniref:cytochrome P450 705A22-like n=1 Tax=Juglans microcarpa x Juglans regia TaxID=2249226 RepID=UPI001B7DCE36|nr:cytochrome P450 705A22-like [Juglans microcarpa x Juglans regia]